jgi:hypothetical protein
MCERVGIGEHAAWLTGRGVPPDHRERQPTQHDRAAAVTALETQSLSPTSPGRFSALICIGLASLPESWLGQTKLRSRTRSKLKTGCVLRLCVDGEDGAYPCGYDVLRIVG